MKSQELPFDSVESINTEILQTTRKCRLQLLKHYLLYYILYLNSPVEERDDSPMKEKLLKIAIVLEKTSSMKSSAKLGAQPKKEDRAAEKKPADRIIDGRMTKGKGVPVNPRKKFRKNSEKQSSRTKRKADYNI